MIGSKRKYLSDFAIDLYSNRWLLFPATQLSRDASMPPQEAEIANNSHIYMITKIPSFSFCPETFKYEDHIISGNVTYRIKGVEYTLPFKNDFPLLDNAIELKLDTYPHREIKIFDNKGQEVRHLPALVLGLSECMRLRKEEVKNLEILYIGQAFGDGTRTAIDRLKSHSTLQKILSDLNYFFPDDEVYILTFEYNPYEVITAMNGRDRSHETITGKDDIERFYSILDNPLTKKQQISLIEAGLIRYFKPHYNQIYKDSFPSNKHKILEECYKLDFSGLIIQVNTEELGFSLFSERVSPRQLHMAEIDLVGHEDRWAFFHMFFDEHGTRKRPNVISESLN
jgi:hypothetical protein